MSNVSAIKHSSTNKSLYTLRNFLLKHSLHIYLLALLSACGGGGGGGGGSGGGSGGGGGKYTVSVTTSGLTGSGLVVGLSSDAGSDTMSITGNGTKSFSLPLPGGSIYTVGIGTQPSGQSCSLGGNYWGSSISSNVTATVTCVDITSVGGSISGLSGSVTLQLNGGNTTTFSANGSFNFSQQLAVGDYYAVSVYTQPANQLCLVSNGGGQITGAAVNTVNVSCGASSTGYYVGGYISGFSGLAILNLNGTEELARTYNGSFTFSTPLAKGTPYTVSVTSLVTGYSCDVSNGAGVVADSDFPFVDIQCGLTTSGIAPKADPAGANLGTGETITVTLNGSEDMILDDWDWNPVPFSTRLNPGDAYEVTVKTPPVGRYCILFNSVGVIEAGVTPMITMDCVADTTALYTIGGNISGLTGTGLVLKLDGRDSLAITASDTSYVFPNAQPDWTTHTVSIETQPAGQICSVTNDSNWISGTNIGNADIICGPGPYTIGGYAAGVAAAGLSLKLNNTEILDVPASGSFVFSSLFATDMDYSVKIVSHPSKQQCNIVNSAGSNISSSISNIIVDCRSTDYSVAVNVAGYSSSSPLMLQLNGAEIMQVSSNTTSFSQLNPVAFASRLKDADTYSVSIAGQPAGQVCSLTNPSGTINASNVTDVGAFCVSDPASAGPYTVSATVSGLLGSGLQLQLNNANDLAIAADGYNTFATTLSDTSSYSVTVSLQPTSPLQFCQVVNGAGTISAANVTQVSVQCGNAVRSLYSTNGAQWLDYVKNDGVSVYSATDAVCDPTVDSGGYDVCLNGGEFMAVSVAALSTCTNVTAVDNLNAFNWVCDSSSGVRLISTGLKSGVGLSDLVDFSAASFKPNFVTVYNNAVAVDQTQSGIWWSNRVRVNNINDYNQSGDIILMTGSVPLGTTMKDKTAVLVQPGFAVGGSVKVDNTFTSAFNFLWFEGDISGVAGVGLYWPFTTKFSVINNATSSNNTSYGFYLYGDNNKLTNLVANNNGGNPSISVSGNYLTIDGLTANDNTGGTGVSLSAGNSAINNVTASNNINGSGLSLSTTGNVTLSNVVADNNGTATATSSGIAIYGNISAYKGPHTFSNLSADGNGYRGIFVEGLTNSSFTNISANNNTFRGIDIWEASASPLNNLSASGNGDTGMQIYRWDNANGKQWLAANNGLDGIVLGQAANFTVSDVVANNNAQHGYVLDASDRIVSINVTTNNNNGSGVAHLGGSSNSANNILIGATSANNGSHGFEISRMSKQNFSSLLALNNGGNGMTTYTFVDNLQLSNALSANNSGYGFEVGSDYGYYTGLLEMGSNALGDCLNGAGIITQPGLEQNHINPNNLGVDCVLQGTSDATLVTLVDASTSVVGKVSTNDLSNSADDLTPGTASFSGIVDWFQFDNAWRSWGVDGSAFANADNQGACASVATCRIWDWSASAADVGNAGAPAVYNVLALPTATDVLVMDWSSFNATSQAYCDANFSGSVWDGATTCSRTYLRNAREIIGDAIGNDNGLCENGETCLYTPNIGSYQGHGSLVSAGTVGSGADTITLMKYQSLGR